ncbi:MAG: hypothetical protein WD824_03990 [Cyclobacteriaceae bacterium]
MISKATRHLIKHHFIVVVFIPACVFLALILSSLVPGFEPIKFFLLWFIIFPGIILYLSAMLLRERNKMWKSIVSLTSFYGFMVFMIYKHYQSDFFTLMMASFVWNFFVMILVMFIEGQDKVATHGRTAGE